MTSSHASPSLESRALSATLTEVAPNAPTACAGWTAHNISAHLAAGTKEVADLIELKVNHHQQRPTREFAERESPFIALSAADLGQEVITQGDRLLAAASALAQTEDPRFLFTGRIFTVADLTKHMRSESALHRWDIVGDDDLSDQLLTQTDLTRYAVDLLNTMPSLYEAPEWRAEHAGIKGGLRIVLRSPGSADLVYERTDGGARFEVVEEPATGDAVVITDTANRLLTIWGRRSAQRTLTVDTDTVSAALVESVLWGTNAPWDPQHSTR
ncbi:MAG: hypothetical protein QOG95_1702 [Mycobacterium sp.]|jgi:hypothetical protein|nr:hypothetical protein [Mycobacterium sp.]